MVHRHCNSQKFLPCQLLQRILSNSICDWPCYPGYAGSAIATLSWWSSIQQLCCTSHGLGSLGPGTSGLKSIENKVPTWTSQACFGDFFAIDDLIHVQIWIPENGLWLPLILCVASSGIFVVEVEPRFMSLKSQHGHCMFRLFGWGIQKEHEVSCQKKGCSCLIWVYSSLFCFLCGFFLAIPGSFLFLLEYVNHLLHYLLH